MRYSDDHYMVAIGELIECQLADRPELASEGEGMITKDVKRRDRFRASSEKLIRSTDPDPLLRMCDGVSDAARKAERARIREWVEGQRTMMPVEFENFTGYERCLDDLLDFLKQ